MKGKTSFTKDSNDIVITCALRTPLTKALKGGLKDTPLDLMVHALLKEVLAQSKLDPKLIQDVCLGNVGHKGWRFCQIINIYPS
jgi:acetyl-CoA acetyltransferase